MPPDFFDNALKLILVFGAASFAFIVAGIGVKAVFFRRAPKVAPVIDQDELQGIQERLQTTEAKVTELEERLDFAERMLAEARRKALP